MDSPIKVIFIDDHPIVRKGMIQIVADDRELEVVAEAGSAEEALKILEDTAVDVVVIDFEMPGINGLQLASMLRERTPPLPVVILTMYRNPEIFGESIRRGVQAYLLKEEAVGNIATGIKAVARGEFYASPSMSKYIAANSRQSGEFLKWNAGFESLTVTERNVLKKVSEGKSSKEIAAEMGVSYRTITTHRHNISSKLGIAGSRGLVDFALLNRTIIHSLLDS